MKEFIIELKTRNELLFYFGVANMLLAIVFFVLMNISTTQVAGVNAWNKPLKFALSITIYCFTMGWFMAYLPAFNANAFAWTVIILFGFEIIYIGIQAARGQMSHFNQSAPIYGVLFALMGLAASAVTAYTAYIAFLFFTKNVPTLPVYYLWSIRLGLVLFVIFSFEGALMGARLSHLVGCTDGGKGLAFVHWSLSYGDLRVAHFVGMHALQILPLLSYYLLRNTTLTFIISLFYALLASFILYLALKGRAIIKAEKQHTYIAG